MCATPVQHCHKQYNYYAFLSLAVCFCFLCLLFSFFSSSSYLLGLLAKIKCSISSSQPDLWDREYFSRRMIRKISETILVDWSYLSLCLQRANRALAFELRLPLTWPRYCSISESCGSNKNFIVFVFCFIYNIGIKKWSENDANEWNRRFQPNKEMKTSQ